MLNNLATIRVKNQLLFFFIFSLSIYETLFGNIIQEVIFSKPHVKACLLPENHPLQNQLKFFFINPDMFQSQEHLRMAGFHPINKMRRGFMVASHPGLKHYLIKKFDDTTPYKKQLKNYLRRISGARALHNFIKLNNLKHIIVPQKWLYPLPPQFFNLETGRETYVLIVEEIDICDGGNSPEGVVARKYYNMDLEILRELCIVVYYFRGLDSGLQNMPFTHRNKIAFIDTEHWGSEGRVGFLRHAIHYLSPDRQEYALAVFKELAEQDQRNLNLDEK